MDEEITIGVMSRTPQQKRVSIIRKLRRNIDNLMEEYEQAMCDFAEYSLGNERKCIENCLCDLWKHQEMLNELIRNSDTKIKEAQDEGRGEVEEENKTETTTESKPKEIKCPDCGRKGEETDICPECGYEF